MCDYNNAWNTVAVSAWYMFLCMHIAILYWLVYLNVDRNHRCIIDDRRQHSYCTSCHKSSSNVENLNTVFNTYVREHTYARFYVTRFKKEHAGTAVYRLSIYMLFSFVCTRSKFRSPSHKMRYVSADQMCWWSAKICAAQTYTHEYMTYNLGARWIVNVRSSPSESVSIIYSSGTGYISIYYVDIHVYSNCRLITLMGNSLQK